MLSAVLFALVSVALIAALAHQHTTGAAAVEALTAAAAAERAAHRGEVQTLLQRIQAPQAAIIQHAQETSEPGEVAYPLDETEQAQAQDYHLAAQAVLEQIHQHEVGLGMSEPVA